MTKRSSEEQQIEIVTQVEMADDPDDAMATLDELPSADTASPNGVVRDAPAAGAPMATPKARMLGDYELLDELGEGGMGVVYKARQQSADRIVALKVIRPDKLRTMSPSKQQKTIERFRTEARAAAQIDHENLVTVYDVGEVDGQHFFSMRYVEGKSLSEMLLDGPMSNKHAARFIEQVSRGVHEAHVHGVLHRDLKPQNILVDARTGRALVADFGLAKFSEDETELTRPGEVMGTPHYMSPEQARDAANVTTQTDIYALGATLYHLLTGRPPFQAATPVETLRQVMDVEPVAPRQLNPAIDRDLETICLKCLEKEPSRRYESSQLVAEELRRVLKGEPIQARPLGWAARTWRWCRRNPLIASTAATALLCLILALLATTVGYVKTSAAQQESEESFREALQAVNDFFTTVSEDTLLNQPGMQPLRKDLLNQALDYYQRFLARRANDPTIRDKVAVTFFSVGRITQEIESPAAALDWYDRARTLHDEVLRDHPDSVDHLQAFGNTLNAQAEALSRLQRTDDAVSLYQDALGVRKRLVDAEPDRREFQRTLANTYMNIGIVEKRRSQFAEARQQMQQAQELREKLLLHDAGDRKTQRDTGVGHYNLANVLLDLDESSAAGQSFENAIRTCEALLADDDSDIGIKYLVAVSYRRLADLKSVGDDQTVAPDLYGQARTRMQTLALQNPAVTEYQAALAGILLNLGQMQYGRQEFATAIESLQQSADSLQQLLQKAPKTPGYRRDLTTTLQTLARAQLQLRQLDAAGETLGRLQTHLQQLAADFPDEPDYETQLRQTEQLLQKVSPARPAG